MSYVIYNPSNRETFGRPLYDTERGAKIALTRTGGEYEKNNFQVVEYQQFLMLKALTKKTITVKSLMTGQEVEIDEDTPWCCRPDSESFWSN